MQTPAAPIRVPSDIADDIELLVQAIRDAAEREGQAASEAVRVVRPQTKGMVVGGEAVLLLLVGTGFSWLTKKWFDTLVWPELEKRLKKPTRDALDFLFDSLNWKDPDQKAQDLPADRPG